MAKHAETKTEHYREADSEGSRLTVPRSRGAIGGILLIVLGAWGALLPLIGPHFHLGFGPDNDTFNVTEARFWLQILPGVVTVVAGLILLVGANRISGIVFGYLACAAGAWFVVGPVLADLRSRGYVGTALGSSDRQHIDQLVAFSGLGAIILFFAAQTVGRMSVVGVRDVRVKGGQGERHEEVFPATREVPVTTTSIRPAEAPEVITLPVDEAPVVEAPAAGAVADRRTTG